MTATVIDLYVCWDPGFRSKLEALLLSVVSAVGVEFGVEFECNDSTTWFQLKSTVGGLEFDWTRDDSRLGLNDSMTWQ